MKYPNSNIIQFPQRDPTVDWVARHCRVSTSVARTIAELANVRGFVDPWIPLADVTNKVVDQLRASR
ncbi:MAG: hypothetical protein Q8M31_23685 [Beijerinckiaceae bacterium]|nr:hypothetical protein [Beijerinckiaceae bacterium]